MGLLYAATALEKATGVYVENHFNFLSKRRIRAQKRTEKKKEKEFKKKTQSNICAFALPRPSLVTVSCNYLQNTGIIAL